ncbi:DUF1642 domain-containing protein [Tetragenococcus muriaticus]|nr:DUF1642 domain-containing protein [Tetragenococcus muriaticus]
MDKQELIEKYEKLIQQNEPELEESKLAESRSKLYNNILRELKRMDDGITTEQAWEKIAEKFEEGPKELCATLVSALPPYNLSEKPEIPQFVAKEIPSEPTEALDSYYNPGVYIVPPYSYKVINWIEGHFDIFLQALVNGFEIQKQPVWVVRINEKLYFCRFTDKYFKENPDEPTYSESGNPELVKKFTDKAKAEAVATLINGEVEEWSE